MTSTVMNAAAEAGNEAVGIEPIAVVGMALRVPGAGNIDQFWENLVAGVESLSPLDREQMIRAGASAEELDDPNLVAAAFLLENAQLFDADLFGMSSKEADVTDPQHRLFLELCHTALENAGHDPARFDGDIGVFAGRGTERYRWEWVDRNRKFMAATPLMFIGNGNLSDNITTLASYKLNLTGPSVGVFTACSTSLVAVHMACESLRAGECEMVLAGGVSIELPIGRGHLYEEGGVESADGHVRPFDAAASGTMWSSGGGVVVLRRLSDALADGDHIHAVVRGNAITNDGSGKVGFTAPSVHGQAAAIAGALAGAGIDPGTVTYIEAHGTGTRLGDPIEVTALTSIYGRHIDQPRSCGIGSVKGNIGHLSHGAGVVGMIKVMLAMQNGIIPPSLNFNTPNPRIDFENGPFRVITGLSKWEPGETPRRAGVSSFGVGGTNAHVIVEEAPGRPRRPAPRRDTHLIELSARTETALAAAIDQLATKLDGQPDLDLADVAYTLRVGRSAHPHRAAVVATDVADAAVALRNTKRRLTGHAAAGKQQPVALLFPGQGAQYAGMGAQLYASEPVFARIVDECAEALMGELGEDIRELLFATGDSVEQAESRLAQTALTQPAIFTVSYALAELWRSWGLEPATMIGHSVGEYVAATVAGVFRPADAARLVAIRGRLMQSMAPGAMLAVMLDADEVAADLPEGLSIAAVNGPGTCVVAGPHELINAYAESLAGQHVTATRLRTSHAFHSTMMEPMLDAFRAAVAAVDRRSPRIPFLSNRTGEPITEAQATDPNYWADHVRNPVRFGACVARLLADGPVTLLECGPGKVLTGLARMQAPRDGYPLVHSLPSPTGDQTDLQTLYAAVGRLRVSGVRLDGFGAPGRRIPLPTYPYERKFHWIEPDPDAPGNARVTADSRPGRRTLDDWFTVPTWRQLPPSLATTTLDRCLLFAADEVAAGVGERLRAGGTEVIEVAPGSAYERVAANRYTLRPGDPGDYGALVADLLADGPLKHVVHAWALAGEPAGFDTGATWRAQDSGLFSLLYLVQALSAAAVADGARIDVVTRGTQHVFGDDLTRPEHATVAGIVRSVPYDVPVVTRHIDVGEDDADAGALVAGELRQAYDEVPTLVVFRGGQRWVPEYQQVRIPEPGDPSIGLRKGGVYLITGGTGGLGLTIADDLARRVQAKLILLARSPLPPRAEWDGYLAVHGSTGRTGQSIAAIRRMEAAGAEVLTIAADVTDVGALQQARAEALGRFGRIDGIVHTAGIAGGGVTETRQRAEMMPVLLPKMTGTLALREVFGGLDLDAVVLFSSATGVVGGLGEVDYCAANAYLDAHAQSVNAWGVPVRSLGWAGWRDVGMLAVPVAGAAVQQPPANVAPMDHPLLDEMWVEPDGATVCTGTLSADKHWVLADHRIDGVPVLPATAQLEALHAAATAAMPAAGDGDAFEFSEVLFVEPFAVPDGTTAQVRVTIRRADDLYEATLTSPVGGVDRVFCSARVRWVQAPAPPQVDPAGASARCESRPDLVEISHQLPGGLVQFGPHWRNVREVWLSETEQLTVIEASDLAREELGRWAMHPALLDQSTFNLSRHVRGYLPMGYGQILVRDRLPERLWVHRPISGDGGEEVRTDDFTIVDETGRELVAVTDFMLRRIDSVNVSAAAAAAAPKGGNSVPAAAVGPIDAAAELWMAPADGAEAFHRALSAPLGGHVLISPTALTDIGARARARAIGTPERGIIDVDAPSQQQVRTLPAGHIPPRTPSEVIVADICSAVLGVPDVGAEDDFFDLSGNSLVAVHLISHLRKATGLTLPMRVLFETRTVAHIAAWLDERQASAADAPTNPAAATPTQPQATTIPSLTRSSLHG